MLFSSDGVAQYINENFEPVWESVRPVPLVTIDFGNGHTITRTLNGNIATQVCTADGQVLDILPGVYTAEVYRKQLEQLVLLHQYVMAARIGRPDVRLKDYHEQQASLLGKNQPRAVFMQIEGGPSILGIERTVQLVVGGRSNRGVARRVEATPPVPPSDKLAGWKELAEDTRINETVRRLQIHRKLAESGKVQPRDITKWLYKEILKADLDDPYLGLTETLNKHYPFVAEEAAAKPKK